MTTGYVPGGFDLFHIGHLNILRESRFRCDVLIVGVATDELLVTMKGHQPVIPFAERHAIVSSIRTIDYVVADTSADKRVAWEKNHFDVLFKGTDWQDTSKGHQLEQHMSGVGVKVVYLPYTPRTSSTTLRTFINSSSAFEGA